MVKRLFAFIIYVIVAVPAVGQNLQLIEKLKNDLATAKDESRYAILNDLAWEYRTAYPDSTIFYAKQALVLGKKLNLTKGLAEALNFIGVAENYKGNRIGAYEYYDSALLVSQRQDDSIQTAYSNNNLGRLFFEQGLLARSYDYFVRALAIFEAIDDPSGLAYTYQSMANLYKSQRDFEKAESNYLKAYKIRLKLGNTRDIMSALAQLGRFYQDHNEHDKALKTLHKADSTGQVINDEINLAEIKTLIANSYLSKGLLREAEAICNEGLKVILRVNNVRLMPLAYITMGQIKFYKGELQESRKYLSQATDMATRTNDLNSKMNAHYWLWKLAEKEHNNLEILKNHNLFLLLKDSVKDLDLTRQVERLQFQMEIQNKEQENQILKAEDVRNEAVIQQQRLQNIILIIVVVSISILVFVQWRNNKIRNEANIRLEKQNQFIEQQGKEISGQNDKLSKRNIELSDLNYEKDTLMSIVAHDLKSPLNRIKGIIGIMKLEGGLSENQKTYIQMTEDATQSGLDLIKDLLDVHMLEENIQPVLSTFDISLFLFEKTKTFQHIAESKQIHLQISRVENVEVTLDANYLSRIVDNLLSNAIKFSKRNSTVNIAAGKSTDFIWVSVKDHGPGFSEGDKVQLFQKFKKLSARPTAGETSNGLGLAIVKTLVDRMHGTIELVSEPNKGSEFMVKFPIIKEA